MPKLYFIDINKNLEFIKLIDDDIDSKITQITEYVQNKYNQEPIFTVKNKNDIKIDCIFKDGLYVSEMSLFIKKTIVIEGIIWNSHNIIFEKMGSFVIKNTVRNKNIFLKKCSSDKLFKLHLEKFNEELNEKINLYNKIKNNNSDEKFLLIDEIFDFILKNKHIINSFHHNHRKNIYNKLREFEKIINDKYSNKKLLFNPQKYINHSIFSNFVNSDIIQMISLD